MARRYSRDNRGRFAGSGGGATARGGRLRTAAGNKRKTQTMQSAAAPKGTIGKPRGLKPGAIKTKSAATTRKGQLAAGAKKRNAQADRIDAKVKKLEGEYRSKDAAFYTQGAKPAGRDRMIAKSQQAAQLREQSAALRSKAANAERMSNKIKTTTSPIKSSGGDQRLGRAIRNEAAGSTSYRRNPKGYQKRIKALEAQKIYKTGDTTSGLTLGQMAGKGFRLPRNERAAAKPAAPKGTIGKPRGLKQRTVAKSAPSAAAIAQAGREKRATRNLNTAMKREGDGPNSKASRSASVAKRARAIYAGKVDPKQKTAARLTRTTNPEALRRRIKKQKG
jgi:hypothetical protein